MRLRIRPPLRNQSNSNKSYTLALRKYFEAKATATNHTSSNWGTTSKPKQWQQIVHLSIRAPLRDQSNGNKSHISALGHLGDQSNGFKSYILALGGTTSSPEQRQQIAYLRIGAPLRDQSNSNKSLALLRDQSNGNKSYILAPGTTSRPKQRQQIAHPSIEAPLRDQSDGNKSYIFELGHRFEAKATATNRTSQHWGTT